MTDIIKGDQVEAVEVKFLDESGNPTYLGDGVSPTVTIKTTKDSSTVLCQATLSTYTGGIYSGSLDLRNVAVRALGESHQASIEIGWGTSRSDDARITIRRAVTSGLENVPVDGTAEIIADFVADNNILQGTYDDGHVHFTLGGVEYKFRVTPV